MKRITRLIREAREAAEWRGHKMRRFTHWSRGAAADCLECGLGVSVLPKPRPNEIDIGRPAVAVGCDAGQAAES